MGTGTGWRRNLRRAAIGGGVPLALMTMMALLLPGSAAADAPENSPCAPQIKACVDLGMERAWLTDGQGRTLRGPMRIAAGTEEMPTPVGTFAVMWKHKDHFSAEFQAPMPNSVFFEPGIAFHEGVLSRPSGGCVKLSEESAAEMFDHLQPFDQVQVRE